MPPPLLAPSGCPLLRCLRACRELAKKAENDSNAAAYVYRDHFRECGQPCVAALTDFYEKVRRRARGGSAREAGGGRGPDARGRHFGD